ncbi:MAG: hypothetical protein Q4F83_14020 [Eubacteriales bacterium]|nr:hypothetical protein [Eubacteriales bacterium]
MNKKLYLQTFGYPLFVLMLILLAVCVDDVIGLALPVPAALLPLAAGGGKVCYDTLRSVIRSRKITAGLLVVLALIGSVFTGEFMEGAEVSFMMLLGEALEDFSVEKTWNNVRRMMERISHTEYGRQMAPTGEGGSANRLADRFSRYFFPLVLGIGILVGLTTRDIHRVMTIFVIACPCSLMLSSPIAVLTCIGNAAKKGILIADGETVERCGGVRSVSGPVNGIYTADNGLTFGIEKKADIIFTSNDDTALSNALALTRRTRTIIWQNILFFACFVNLAGIVLSGLGYLNPVLGALIHNGSTVCVVLNSLRLLR